MSWRPAIAVALGAGLWAIGCQREPAGQAGGAARGMVPASGPRDFSPPQVDTTGFQAPVMVAIEVAGRQVLQNPQVSKAWFLYAATLDAHNLAAEAAHCYDVALALDPHDKFVLYNAALQRETMGDRLDEALELMERASAYLADYPPMWRHLARMHDRRGDRLHAAEALRRAVALSPGTAVLHMEYGQTLMALGREAEAMKQLERAAAIVADAPTLAALSRGYLSVDQADRAEQTAEQAVRAGPIGPLSDPIREGVERLAMNSTALLDRGSRRMDAGDYAGAIAELKLAARYLTNNASLHLRLGICHFAIGRLDEARRFLLRTIELRDSMAQAHQFMGRIEAATGRHEEAIRWFRAAIEREPDNAEHLELLGATLERTGRLADAIDAYRAAVALDAGATAASLRLAELLTTSGDPPSANDR